MYKHENNVSKIFRLNLANISKEKKQKLFVNYKENKIFTFILHSDI